MKRLFIDVETGGIDPERHSLLTLGLCYWKDGVIFDSDEFSLRSDPYHVSPGALAINGIDLVEHSKTALSSDRFVANVNVFLERHWSNDEKIWLAGHNPGFDRGFLKYALPKETLSRFHYRMVDTAAILHFLLDSGVVDVPEDVNLEKALQHFGIADRQRHSALSDACYTAKLYNRLLVTVSAIGVRRVA